MSYTKALIFLSFLTFFDWRFFSMGLATDNSARKYPEEPEKMISRI